MGLCTQACCNAVARAQQERIEQLARAEKERRYFEYLRSQGIQLSEAEQAREAALARHEVAA